MADRTIGRFEILGELGRGGQGMVYLAYDPQLHRKVAIKTLRKFGHRTELLTREAQIVSKLQHPNIIPLYDAGENNGLPYLVYAYIEGKTLAQMLVEETCLSLERAAEIACDALRGLSHAHMQGITHLDIKPANIMIAKNGIAMVMDFGLATTSNTDEPSATGMINGTPRYVAPEIISGATGGPLADLYALGAVLYEAVTGHPAVPGENLYEVLNRAAHETVIPPSAHREGMDETLEKIILNALAKQPQDRYPNAASMLEDLTEYLNASHGAATEFLLQRMRSKQDFPAISGVIAEINRVVATESEGSSRLTGVILQDLALTNKLLRLVNTAAFSQYGGSINTVSKAVMILGFETIRNIATSLILLELLQNKVQAIQLREEIAKAILAGEIAARISPHHELRDVEEVMICAMFRNLGKMLAMYYFFDESQEIAGMTRDGEDEQTASARILGVPYAELGIHVARRWNFPPRLLAGMRQLPQGEIPAPKNELDRLASTINLAYELCEIANSTDIRDKPARLEELESRYRNSGTLAAQELAQAFDAGLNEVGKRAATLGIGLVGSPLLTRAREWSGRPPLAAPEQKGANLSGLTDLDHTVAQRYGKADSLTLSPNPDSILGAGIQEVTNTMMGQFNLTDVLQMVLETLYRGIGFQRAIFMLRNIRENTMLARFGFGPDVERIIPHFRFPLPFSPDVFHLALDKGADISIEDVRSLNISDKIPQWYHELIDAPCFLLLPLMLNDKPIGLIYADMAEANQLDISRQQLALLRTLRNQAVLAIKQKV